MPVPEEMKELRTVSLEQFRARMVNNRARESNIRAQDHFCWWCGEFAANLIAKYWHGFCTEKCWKEYRDSRLRK